MVNNKDFGNRIQKIMDHYSVSAAAFADYMGVGRSSISHILSGRNKPSLDFVMKIVAAYNDVNLQWLLYGKGSFPDIEKKTTEEEKITSPTSIEVPSDLNVSTPSDQDLFSQPQTDQEISIHTSNTFQEKHTQTNFKESSIDKIVIFYADGTFKSYIMDSTKKS